jgi:type II secretory pathway pseudopilin PulG
MGATTFYSFGTAASNTGSRLQRAQQAFDNARLRAQEEYDDTGYTGSILEKRSFTMINVPEGVSRSEYIQQLFNDCDPRIDDKWGPAGCVEVGPHGTTFLFFGWASE